MNSLSRPAAAIGFGAFLICAETCLHFEAIQALRGSLGIKATSAADTAFVGAIGLLFLAAFGGLVKTLRASERQDTAGRRLG